jgi:hypothetical protein
MSNLLFKVSTLFEEQIKYLNHYPSDEAVDSQASRGLRKLQGSRLLGVAMRCNSVESSRNEVRWVLTGNTHAI